MKIEGNSPNQVGSAEQAQAAERAKAAATERATQQQLEGTDRVQVSADARLVDEAVKAAREAPEIRQDLVEQARLKLQAGEVGRDTSRLADRLIDHLLGK